MTRRGEMKLWQRLDDVARLRLAELPTPLTPMPRLSRELGINQLWIKRDDLIGFGFGGNKVRGLEFLIADALAQQSDVVITGAGSQSNHVRATAFAAAHSGLRCVAVYWGPPAELCDGNYRLTRMLEAEIRFTGDADRTSVDLGIDRAAERCRSLGLRPYSIPRGGACVRGVLGHIQAVRELYEQCRIENIRPDAVVFATGSGGTHAGWLVGSRAVGASWRVESVTVSREAGVVRGEIVRLANEAAEMLDLSWRCSDADVIVHDGYIGEGYGIPSPEASVAIKRVGRTEGILLDPTYTGKAMAALMDRIRADGMEYRTTIFLHTGGEPAFFAGDGEWLC